jgi:hypothetical protein
MRPPSCRAHLRAVPAVRNGAGPDGLSQRGVVDEQPTAAGIVIDYENANGSVGYGHLDSPRD